MTAPTTGRQQEARLPAGLKDYACRICGEEFRSNCDPGDIQCPECDARLCPCCGAWFSEEGIAKAPPADQVPSGALDIAWNALPARPSPAELWEQSGGNRDLYRDLLREHGHLLAPGEPGYDPDGALPPCGWSPP